MHLVDESLVRKDMNPHSAQSGHLKLLTAFMCLSPEQLLQSRFAVAVKATLRHVSARVRKGRETPAQW